MKQIRRIAVLAVGGTVLAIGIALIVLPGPAFIVIPLGLAILAMEFAWARRWLRSARAVLPVNFECRASTTERKIEP
jgi:tellurite resistance protein TerC